MHSTPGICLVFEIELDKIGSIALLEACGSSMSAGSIIVVDANAAPYVRAPFLDMGEFFAHANGPDGRQPVRGLRECSGSQAWWVSARISRITPVARSLSLLYANVLYKFVR